jgi:hypothetical protein
MKTFDKKDVYSWSNAEKARQYMRKEGYFADSIAELDCKIQGEYKNILTDIFASDTDRASCPFGNDDEETWSLFIPTDKVKKEKKWRAFKSIDEFKKETGLDLLSKVHYRYITEKPKTITTIGFGVITDFCTCSDETYYITIGDTSFNLNELFDYEYLVDGVWQPFGVEE